MKLFYDNKDSKENCIITAIVMTLFIPLKLITSAGYVAGSINYIWTGAMLLTALLPFKKSVTGQAITKVEGVLYLLAALYCSNQEQSMALLITFSALLLLYCKLRGHQNKYIWFQTHLQ